jgi:hypothetical protein
MAKYIGFINNFISKVALSDSEKTILGSSDTVWKLATDADIQKVVSSEYEITLVNNNINFKSLATLYQGQTGLDVDPNSPTYGQQVPYLIDPSQQILSLTKDNFKSRVENIIKDIEKIISLSVNNNEIITKWKAYLVNLKSINYDNLNYPLTGNSLPLILINNNIVDNNFTLYNI